MKKKTIGKRILAVVMALCVVMMYSVVAFAEEGEDGSTGVCFICTDDSHEHTAACYAEEHTYGDPVTVEATCTEEGSVTKTCSECDAEEVEVIPATGHVDLETGICSVCGYKTISKEAEELDESYKAKVTLAIPSEEVQLASDVVFVLDRSSCKDETLEAFESLIEELSDSVNKAEAKVFVGAVMFKGGVEEIPLIDINSYTPEEFARNVKKLVDEVNKGPAGSNMHLALIKADEMLSSSPRDNSRKYIIVVSDGNIYTWDDNGNQVAVPYYAGGDDGTGVNPTDDYKMDPSPTSFAVHKKTGELPTFQPNNDDWDTYLKDKQSAIDNTIGSEYVQAFTRDKAVIKGQNAITYSQYDNGEYADTVEMAIYYSLNEYKKLCNKYNCYSYPLNYTPTYYGVSFMRYLSSISKNKTTDFSVIKNDIVYYMGKGSYVEDYMGFVEDDYNFDLDTTEDIELKITHVDDSCDTYIGKYADSKYTFTDSDGKVCDDYSLVYTPADNGDEKLVWTFNKNVSNFDRVALTYTVKLMNPKAAQPGETLTFGQYDKYGQNKHDSLYTNNEAKLHRMIANTADGTVVEGDVVTFSKPTVSYTVSAPKTETPGTIIPTPDTPQTPPQDNPNVNPDGNPDDIPSDNPEDKPSVDPNGGSDAIDGDDSVDSDPMGDPDAIEDDEDISAEPKGVKTGDATDMIPWALGFGTAVMLLGGAVALRRREE